ncbi:MAG TPA: DNA-formamidopyrimidine glycosylase family protein [Nocardioidaceae bacterium]|nr:DNA-formamidopyrimidine glycosylase family protein [Nocardioidaceae bacterium]
MPEGDTVWRTARHLDEAMTGLVLQRSDFRVPALATVDLAGAEVLGTVSRGKHLLTRFGPVPHDVSGPGPDRTAGLALTLHTHLKMEGSWHLYRPGSRWRRPAHEARVALVTEEWTAVGFALGTVELVETSTESDVLPPLGPDLLGPDWDAEEAVRRLAASPDRPVGEALLDQRNLAGIGNLYKSELCFLLGADPWTPVSSIDLARLVRRAKAVLEANKERVEQTTTGDLRRGRRTWVYRRDGQPCRRCGTPIRVAMQGPDDGGAGLETAERATYWCPTCQPR